MISPIEENVFTCIEDKRENMIKYLQKLVHIDTQVPPGLNYDVICETMADKFSTMNCDTKIHVAPQKYLDQSGADFLGFEGPRSNIVARYHGVGGGPTLHISAHTDCAAIQTEGWTVDPLGGTITKESPRVVSAYDRGGGYIWGRGVSDDKGEIAAMTLALEAIQEAGVQLKGDLVLTGNCDEEIGGIAGLGFLIREGIVKADIGIQLDGGLTEIYLAAMGRTRFLLRSRGVSYHGQLPILGINAIEKMSKLNVALTQYWRNVLLKRQVPVPGMTLGEHVRKAGINNLTAMLNIGTIKGGVQGGTVPDLCEEELLRGMLPGETFEQVHKELQSVLEGVKATDADLQYELEVINIREGYIVQADDPYAVSCREIIKDAVGRELLFIADLGSNDMNYQVVDGKMSCINFGVGGPYSNAHKQDEIASIDEIIACSKAVALLFMR